MGESQADISGSITPVQHGLYVTLFRAALRSPGTRWCSEYCTGIRLESNTMTDSFHVAQVALSNGPKVAYDVQEVVEVAANVRLHYELILLV